MVPLSVMPMNSRFLPPFLAAFLVAALQFPVTGFAQSGDRRSIGPDTIVVLPVSGEITKATHVFLRRALKLADRANAKAVILEMDTDGGDLAATSDIQKALLSVKVPTYTFINTNAASAGALISIATKQIWMAPVSTIGAAAPVSGGGQDLQSTMREKVTSYFSARARSIAEQQGHNPDIAEAFMNKEKEVKIGDEIINPKGTLLSLSANSAARWINGKPVLAQGIATSLADLTRQAGIGGPLIKLEPTGFEKMAQFIASLAPLFLLGGLVCAYLEFKMPGTTLPGVLAVMFFALFFGGHYLAGLAGFEIIALFLLGVLLILVELIFFPGVILPAVIGAALMLVAIVLAMADRYPSQPLLPSLEQLALPLINLGLALGFAALVITILMSMLPKTSMYRRFVLAAAVEGGSAGPLVTASSVLSGLGLGMTGVTRTPLRPAGKAQFGDTIVDVVSEGGFVETGIEVHIEEIEGARVMVATKRAAAPDVRP
jgi:membrane-bound serine protease (ClpP class)